MKRKTKLFFSLASLCFSLAVLCFGVYSAMSVSYSISGSVSYEVTDAFVDITTTVYSSNAIATTDEELLSLANEFVNTIPSSIGDNKTVTHVSEYDDVFDFNTLTGTLDENNGYTPETSLDLTFGTTENVYTYFVVVNIKNLADNVVYTKISNMTDNVEGLGLIATDSNLRIFSDQESGQSIVFGYAISDLTKSQDNTPITFSIEITSQAPYTYAELSETNGSVAGGEAFLSNYRENGESKYNNKLKSITFTNNQADFDMTAVVDTFDVGEVYNEENVKVAELYTYFIPNGDLYDAFCYASVNIIYAPEDSGSLFCDRHLLGDFTSYEDIRYVWQQNFLTTMNFKAFDVKNANSLQSFITYKGVGEILNMHFDTSRITNFNQFLASSQIETLDLSCFSFNSITNSLNVAGMIGVNDYYLSLLADSFSGVPEIVSLISNIINEQNLNEKISLFSVLIGVIFPAFAETQTALGALGIYSLSIQKIICPKDLNGLVIATPGETPYLIEGTNEETFVLVEGATLIAKN